MADALVSKLLGQLASITFEQAQQEVRLVVGVDKEVKKLESNLRAISDVLEDAERRQVKEATVKHWLAEFKDVSYDMDDVLDEWSTAILKREIEGDESVPMPMWKVCFFILSSCFCIRQVEQVVHRRDIANKIKKINERLDAVAIEKGRYDFHFASRIDEPQPQPRMTASVVDVSEVRGRVQDKNTVVKSLLSESGQGPTLPTISIVGMGGLGKTTLAQLVYNDDTVKVHFQKRIWVCVSDPFNEIRIAKAILESLKDDVSNFHELDPLLGRMCQSLEGQKFLLVLDDVWTEDDKSWQQLKNCLKCGSPGSKILVTTRKQNVATVMGTTKLDMFSLGILSEEDCWSLFSQIAFFERTSEEREKLEGIGREIVDKCKGLPLAAKTLGSLLRFKRTKEQWQSVLNSEVWNLEDVEKDIFPFLLLSYYDLSSTMRRCFSYCAIFPKDYLLRKDKLIQLWMAQGYLRATENEEMEMIGEDYFETLATRSFFQDFERSENGSIVRCKMHDIVHDFAQFLTKNECLEMKVSSFEEPKIESLHVNARHLRMMLSKGVSIPVSIYNLKNLRSLILESQIEVDLRVDELTCLRALDFREGGLKQLSGEVGKLIHLRYLNLSYNDQLEALPETVCELFNLQSLNVVACERLERLPYGLGKLINLRYLQIQLTSIKFMAKGIEKLTRLLTLDNFIVSSGVNDSEASIGDLKNLNHLRGKLEIEGLGNVRDVDEVKKAQLEKKKHLISLTLDFEGEEAEGRMINDEQVIEAIQPPPNLEQLQIEWYRGTSVFPNWMMSLINLKEVTISNCENCELLPPLGKLSSLETLEIYGMTRVQQVSIELLGIESEVNKNDKNEGPSNKDDPNTSSSSLIAFPKLKQLLFWGLDKWEEWDYGMRRRMGEEEEDITTATTISIMPRLASLIIIDCPKLKALPDHIFQTTSLKELNISHCDILKERYYKEREGEDWPKISHIPNITIDSDDVQRDGHLVEERILNTEECDSSDSEQLLEESNIAPPEH